MEHQKIIDTFETYHPTAASGVVEVVPSRMLLYCCPRRSPFFLVLLASQHGPRRDDDGDCKNVVAPWWVTRLVEHFGSFGVWFFGGREKSLSSRHQRGDACGCRPSFLKGVGCTSSLFLVAYQGKP
jgi:hypothetical protein